MKGLSRLLWLAVIILALIGIVVAVRRLLDLGGLTATSANPRAPDLDAGFAQYPLLTTAHVVPGLLFMVLGPLQFVRRIRARHPRVHRWLGRVFVASSVVIGVTALLMTSRLAIGGANETAATTMFALLFLAFLTKAVVHIRRRELALHREWMLRTYAIGLAIATVRPIVALFFVLSPLSPHEFFGIAFWLGFVLHLVAAEVWINVTRPMARVAVDRDAAAWGKATATRR